MIWRILGFIGAGSFFVNGFSLLSDPTCVSADFGGGRVIQVTCRSDASGTFSGTEAGLISLFIGVGLLALIFFNQIKQFFNRPSLPPEWKTVSITNPEGLVDIKICDYCDNPVSLDLQKCPGCSGTYFHHKKVSPALMSQSNTNVEVDTKENQTKKCPMCAEEIKLEAIKCRFCQHSFVETATIKFSNSANLLFRKAFSKPNVGITVTLLVVGLIGLGLSLDARSKSIEKNTLLASGEVCATSEDGTLNFGCADYPNYSFRICQTGNYQQLYFDKTLDSLGDRTPADVNAFDCLGKGPSFPNLFEFTGTIDKLRGEYLLFKTQHQYSDYVEDDSESAGYVKMTVKNEDLN